MDQLPAPRRLRRIMIVTERSNAHGRGVLLGVNRFARPNRPWMFLICQPLPGTFDAAMAWQPDGIIAQAFTRPIAERLLRATVPVVTVSNSIPDLPLPRVANDDDAIGRLGARYLLDRGFRQFAFFGGRQAFHAQVRSRAFSAAVRAAGCPCRVLLSARMRSSSLNLDQVVHRLGRWLAALPRPVAIMAGSDEYGLLVTQACNAVGLAVPEQVAVLGVDNDELTCQWTHPPLSSIRTATQRIGYEAATLLEQIMQGQSPNLAPLLIPPLDVVTRQSTDVLPINDRHLAAAMRFIATQAAQRINAGDVCAAVGLSRRTLERRFRHVLSRSILDEIQRVRLAHARQMLADTSLPVPRVAVQCGFRDAQHFWTVFRRRSGESPSSFRRRHQIDRSDTSRAAGALLNPAR